MSKNDPYASCSNAIFGDPLHGEPKVCYCYEPRPFYETNKWHEDNCDNLDCEWQNCEWYEMNHRSDPCWKEICDGCDVKSCILWYEVGDDWATDDCKYWHNDAKTSPENMARDANDYVNENFSTTIDTVQDMFCQGGKCAEALGQMLSETVKSNMPDENLKDIAESGFEDMDNAFDLNNATDPAIDLIDGKTKGMEPDCEGFFCDLIKAFFDGFSGF